MHTYSHSIHHCSLGLLTLLIIFLFVYVLYLTFVWTIFWLSLPVTDASFWVWPDGFVHAVSFWVFQWFQPTSVVSYPSLVLTFCIFLALFGRISQFGGYIVSIIWWLLVTVQIPKLFFYSRVSKFGSSLSERWISRSRSSSSVLCSSSKSLVSKVMFFWISMDSSDIVSPE